MEDLKPEAEATPPVEVPANFRWAASSLMFPVDVKMAKEIDGTVFDWVVYDHYRACPSRAGEYVFQLLGIDSTGRRTSHVKVAKLRTLVGTMDEHLRFYRNQLVRWYRFHGPLIGLEDEFCPKVFPDELRELMLAGAARPASYPPHQATFNVADLADEDDQSVPDDTRIPLVYGGTMFDPYCRLPEGSEPTGPHLYKFAGDRPFSAAGYKHRPCPMFLPGSDYLSALKQDLYPHPRTLPISMEVACDTVSNLVDRHRKVLQSCAQSVLTHWQTFFSEGISGRCSDEPPSDLFANTADRQAWADWALCHVKDEAKAD